MKTVRMLSTAVNYFKIQQNSTITNYEGNSKGLRHLVIMKIRENLGTLLMYN